MDVAAARHCLAGHDAICNMAEARYDFSVLLSAAMANGQTTVLPPSRATAAVAAALDGWRSPLTVKALSDIGLERLNSEAHAENQALPKLTGQVHVFTSGSTGKPVRHLKNWRSLADGARLTAEIVASAGLEQVDTVMLGTTPHQHMYGLEAAIFAGIAHGYCLHDATVFFPADLERAVDEATGQGMSDVVLVTSPAHLRFLEETIVTLPQIRCIISATAPLHRDVARRLEASGTRKVFEIYGSTETGSLARRRSAETDLWTPLDGFRIVGRGDRWFASAPHLHATIALADDIDLESDGRFRLLGRRGDMVRVAGKRQSLGGLNAVLSLMPGLRDGVILSEPGADGDQLSLFVVTNGEKPADLHALRKAVRAHMLGYVDPVFVPRHVHIVDRIPRGDTGKISAADQVVMMSAARRGADQAAPKVAGKRE
ncbi:acyl-CoA synthetase [Limibaculum sp. M0105]|uniref:Acyl-CoA synthetase n=1 Tax=Thermohalobaculum xanthum TaxID=2753746 RepID=A0A8J7MAZ0_9RHOB|nr:AMP-binding protein [Thermohalobaculum xanthum]MBK0400882.1 acyl-CoA synthetase [Thermohalobaculum xanthum]